MNLSFRRSFEKDIRRISDKSVKERIAQIIEDLEEAGGFGDIGSIEKLKGTRNAYKIRIGRYRLGLLIEGESVEFVRVLDRKEIYRRFP